MKVAVGIIKDEQDRILVTQRPLHVPHPGLWEFPGGKLEANETAEAALAREIQEEVGLTVLGSKFLGQITHQYPDKAVQLLVYHVTDYAGEPSLQEGQLDMLWLDSTALNPIDFPEANHAIFPLLG